MSFIGLDGFRHGWVAVMLNERGNAIAFPSDTNWLAQQSFTRAGIDIPIGMSANGERACDRLARTMLRPHGARVFGGARRWLWQEFSDPDKANAEAVKRGQKKVSRQLWHLGKKIIEVDGFVRANRTFDIREVHPDLVFLRLNGGVPVPTKHSAEGLALRRTLLLEAGFAEIDDWLNIARIGSGAKRDDVLDACAVAIAARALCGALPAHDPESDSHGLAMQIWY